MGAKISFNNTIDKGRIAFSFLPAVVIFREFTKGVIYWEVGIGIFIWTISIEWEKSKQIKNKQ